jgi:hypothetical protein
LQRKGGGGWIEGPVEDPSIPPLQEYRTHTDTRTSFFVFIWAMNAAIWAADALMINSFLENREHGATQRHFNDLKV